MYIALIVDTSYVRMSDDVYSLARRVRVTNSLIAAVGFHAHCNRMAASAATEELKGIYSDLTANWARMIEGYILTLRR